MLESANNHLQHSVQVVELHAAAGRPLGALVPALALSLEVVAVAPAAPVLEPEARAALVVEGEPSGI